LLDDDEVAHSKQKVAIDVLSRSLAQREEARRAHFLSAQQLGGRADFVTLEQ
jgi:hypothetical protein